MQTTLRIDDLLYRQAKSQAALEGITLTKFLEQALRLRLASGVTSPPMYEPGVTSPPMHKPEVTSSPPAGVPLSTIGGSVEGSHQS